MTALGPVCGGWEQQTATGVSTVRTGDLCVTTATVAAVLSPHAELALSRTGTAWPPHLSTPTPNNPQYNPALLTEREREGERERHMQAHT